MVEHATPLALGSALAIGLGLSLRHQTMSIKQAQEHAGQLRVDAISARDQICRQIAVDLHDNLCADLARTSLTAQSLQLRVARGGDIHAQVDQLVELSGSAASRLRPIIADLGCTRDDSSISRVLCRCSEMLQCRDITMDSEFPIDIDEVASSDQAKTINAVLREGATNILKYAPASSAAHLTIEVLVDQKITLTPTNVVSDEEQQRRIPVTEFSHGFGLITVRERVIRAGGDMSCGATGKIWILNVSGSPVPV